MQFDPSQMDPKVLMQLSKIVQELPPEKLSQMQTLMHNMMAGYDVRKEMEEFEKSLPPGFRERLAAALPPGAMAGAMGGMAPPFGMKPSLKSVPAGPEIETVQSHEEPLDVHQARLTVLRGVASGEVSPEEAERILFAES